jgi:hypothetical protein
MWPTIKAIRALGGSGGIDEIVEKVVELEGFTEEQQAVLQLAGARVGRRRLRGQVRQGRATDLAPGDRDRRLVRDYETMPETHEAMVWAAGVWTLSRRLAR